MNWRIAFVAILSLGSLAGCDLDPTRTEEGVLRAAFRAIQREKWDDYSRLTITTSDFMLKEHRINRFKEKQSFAGGVLKPEEQARQKGEYLQALRGGRGMIDFRRSKFLGVDSVVDQGHLELLSGGDVPFKVYSIRVKTRGTDPPARSPLFVVVPWQGGFRLLRLAFAGGTSGE